MPQGSFSKLTKVGDERNTHEVYVTPAMKIAIALRSLLSLCAGALQLTCSSSGTFCLLRQIFDQSRLLIPPLPPVAQVLFELFEGASTDFVQFVRCLLTVNR